MIKKRANHRIPPTRFPRAATPNSPPTVTARAAQHYHRCPASGRAPDRRARFAAIRSLTVSLPVSASGRGRSGPLPQRHSVEHVARGGVWWAWGRRRRMYGRRASQLLRELDSCEAGQLAPFNSDVFGQVIRECNEHNAQFQSLIRKMVEQNLDIETTRNEDHYGAAIHHLSLLRNKRCLMAYMYNRAEVFRSFRWKIGPVLPHEIQEKLHFSEKEYFKNHSAAIKSYISEMDIDLTDLVPPKDPYIQVQVLEDIGEVSLGDHSISLTKNSLHFLRRTDTEQFISQGLMEEFLE